ncbi:MAG: hypothetical protein ACK5IJ_02155 [Mangrovibacterium sp.]
MKVDRFKSDRFSLQTYPFEQVFTFFGSMLNLVGSELSNYARLILNNNPTMTK